MNKSRSSYKLQGIYVQHYIPSNTRNQKYPRNHHIPGHNQYMKRNHMLSEKASAQYFDENNPKTLRKIVIKFLYYSGSMDLRMLMVINSLVEVQTKPTIKIVKQVTQFLNFSATNLDAVTGYIKI